jgi:hypothetical protein
MRPLSFATAAVSPSRNWQITSKNRVSNLDLDLDLDVDVDELVQSKLFKHQVCRIAPYRGMSPSKSASRSRCKSRMYGSMRSREKLAYNVPRRRSADNVNGGRS